MGSLAAMIPHDKGRADAAGLASLADPGVEQREGGSVTVYSAIVEPSGRGFWFAGDRTPAASQATWDFVPFPWPVLSPTPGKAPRRSERGCLP